MEAMDDDLFRLWSALNEFYFSVYFSCQITLEKRFVLLSS